MMQESFLWLLTATAGAAPLVGYNQGTNFDYPGLRFDRSREFHITMFNDLHLGDGDKPNTDDKTIGVMNSVLGAEKGTDLVVLNGDLTSCEWVAPEQVNGLIDKIIDPLIEKNLPWATTFGNHDMSKTCNTRLVSEHMWKAGRKNGKKLAWTTPSVQADYSQVGTSNYYIPVYASSGGGNPELSMLLWFFDSRGGSAYDPPGKDAPVGDWVDHQVLSWFRLTRDQIQKDHGGEAIPSLAFVHIPPSVTAKWQKNGLRTATTEPGLNEETIGAQGDQSPGADDLFMQALAETEGLMTVFSGHDHGIDWCMKWSATKAVAGNNPPTGNNIHFCFGRHTGYGGYGTWMRGGRHISIKEDELGQNTLETWMRLEDGSISGRVTLNSTYGKDQYLPVEKKVQTISSGTNNQNFATSSAATKTTLAATSTYTSTTTKRSSITTNSSKSTSTHKPKPTSTVPLMPTATVNDSI